MPIYTTYLSLINKRTDGPLYLLFLRKDTEEKLEKLGSCFVYYIARNRGNNEVAPTETLLHDAMTGRITWETYEESYLWRLRNDSAAQKWMEKRAGEAKIGNILLVCFEKDPTHCHRRLLAEEIARRFGAEYKGEV